MSLKNMESEQKSIGGTKVMLIGKSVVETIESFDKFSTEYLYEVLERLNNTIEDDITLGVTFNDTNEDARFFEFYFSTVSDWEVYLYDLEEIDSDGYLDLILKEHTVSMHNRKIRNIFE